MRIGTFVKTTLSAWKGRDCCFIGVRGGGISCPYYGDPSLASGEGREIDQREILDYIRSRRDTLDGVVIGGGEPFCDAGLYPFLKELRKTKRRICLMTYGACPDEIDDIAGAMMADRVVLFVPAIDPEKIRKAENLDPALLMRSIEVMKGLDCEIVFSTVAVPGAIDGAEIAAISKATGGCGTLEIRQFRPDACTDPAYAGLRPYSKGEAAALSASAKRYTKRVTLEGFRSGQEVPGHRPLGGLKGERAPVHEQLRATRGPLHRGNQRLLGGHHPHRQAAFCLPNLRRDVVDGADRPDDQHRQVRVDVLRVVLLVEAGDDDGGVVPAARCGLRPDPPPAEHDAAGILLEEGR